MRDRDIGTLAEGATACKVWSGDPNPVSRAQEPRAQTTMLTSLEHQSTFVQNSSFPAFSSSVEIMEKMEKYLIAEKSTLNLFGDYFFTLSDFWNILLSCLSKILIQCYIGRGHKVSVRLTLSCYPELFLRPPQSNSYIKDHRG